MNLKQIIPVLMLLVAGRVQAQEPTVTPNIADPRLQIRLPNASGDSLSLSSYLGKVVLLDFWASWCIPCRASNKQLVKLYPGLHQQGLEIFSVSMDESKKDWLRAVAKDKITWIQVNDDTGSWNSKVAADWNISVIPTTFLINKKGDVVAMDLEGAALQQAILALLRE